MPSRDLPILARTSRTTAGDLGVRSSSPLSVTAPAVVLLNVLDGACRGVLVAILVILVARTAVAAFQQAAATFVALFAHDDLRAERALRVLQTLQHRQPPGTRLKGRRRGSRRRRGERGR